MSNLVSAALQLPIIIIYGNPHANSETRDWLSSPEGLRYKITQLSSIADILIVFTEQKPACIIIDCDEPLQILEVLNIHGLGQDTAIIVLSRQTDISMAVNIMKAGAQDFIIKQDLTLTYLNNAVYNAIQKKRLAIEQASKKSEELFRAMAEASPVLIMTCDNEARLTYFNRRMVEYTGRSLSESISAGWESLLHPEDVEPWRQLKLQGRNTHQIMYMELRLLYHNATFRWALMSGAPLYNTEGEFTGFMDSMMDMHERKLMEIELSRAKEQAEESNRKKSEFLSMMSHELRTPLNSIIGYSRMVELGMAGPVLDKQRSYLEQVGLSAQHLLGLINELLDITQIESGKLKIAIQHFKIAPILQEIQNMMQPLAERKQVVLTFECDPTLDSFDADPGRFRQVLLNLISNAIKFTLSGGSVWVRLFPSENTAYLVGEIEDTGIGIPADKISEIFQKFYQVNSSLSREQEGTGLGLTLVKSLVEMQGGTIELESKENIGTIFRFKIPMNLGVQLK